MLFRSQPSSTSPASNRSSRWYSWRARRFSAIGGIGGGILESGIVKHVKKSVLLWYTPQEMYDLVVVEEAGMEQKVAFTAMELAKTLADSGSATLRDILFDTGKATIKPESEPPLKTVIELLKGDPALKLEIQGHTDNVGGQDANLKLSKEIGRAHV